MSNFLFKLLKPICLCLTFLLAGCTTTAYNQRSDVQQFIQQMANKHDFNQDQLSQLFSQINPNKKILIAINKPAEKLPWYKYRPIFVTSARAKLGAQFWQQHTQTLNYAAQTYGVPPEMITAILGVETRYGQQQGSFSAFDALSTLAFDYPKRAPFFRSELEQYLLLSQEIPFNPLAIQGSYAGALGAPQFMPSSYRKYAVSYQSNNYSNLFTNRDDAIVSVANYFKVNGWHSGEMIAIPASIKTNDVTLLPQQTGDPKITLTAWKHMGIYPQYPVASSDARANLLILQTETGPEYWLTFHNFYVITRYNTSPFYAMAAYQLSQLIKIYHLKG